MSTSIQAAIAASFYSTFSKTVGQVTASIPIRDSNISNFTNGTGASQANAQYNASGTINESSAAAFDFVGGGLTDAFGTAVSLTGIKAILITNTHATQPFTVSSSITGLPVGVVAPGGMLLAVSPTAAGYTVAGGSDTITLTNGAGSATSYTLSLIGI